ncbi:TetR/AcrR family transcriptional regulator [Amycolatopsis benzoatilytica]|uniref:TetR/AcrR family transcriptional regulator n=1 Tax=Amycolatopsis benzoatilytica TaxID=346045 RepID=UPI0003747A67|nr:TetR/AcrR family transcriptional regulator [Amycolatopsis benzoatilytica]
MDSGTGRRAELLRQVVDYCATHGIADLSLAPMGEALGTSKRMLLYYFGSRDNLIAEAIAASRPDVTELFRDVEDEATLSAAAHRLWRAITRGRQQRPIRILFQVLALAPTQPDRYAAVAGEAISAMIDPLVPVYRKLGYPEADAAARASLLISGLRGLCLDRMVTGDDERLDTAAAALIAAAVSPAG